MVIADQDTLFAPAGTNPEPSGAGRYNVLVYPNITYARNLEADSYVVVVAEMIRHLLATRDDLAFTMLLPRYVQTLSMPHVRQITYQLPTYPNTMRAHFDTREFLAAIDWKNNSYDIVWSHLPEHTLAIKNVFYNATNERPVFVGYSHWIEVPENTAYRETMIDMNLAGVRAMIECGVNSEWLRALTLRRADERLGTTGTADVERALRVQYLGLEPSTVTAAPEPGLIVWNHRLSTYTGFPAALTALDRLWDERHDFRVMFTLGAVERPYVEPVTIDADDYRTAYLETLGRASIGLGRAGYAPWAISVMDGLEMGIPYVLPAGACYDEVLPDDYPFWYRRGAADLAATIGRALDDVDARTAASEQARNAAASFAWPKRITAFSDMFDRAIADMPMLANATASYDRVRDLAVGGATKRRIMDAMGWGLRVPWTQYRHRLRADGIAVHE